MNLWQALALPWQVTPRWTRWLVIVLLGAAILSATAYAVFSDKPDASARVAGIIGLAEAFVWGLCLTNAVLLTINAHQLRVPGIARCVVAGVLLNGVMGWVLPALVIGGFSGHFVAVGVVIALISACGFLYSLLPRMAGFALYFVLLMTALGKSSWSWPSRPDFLAWALPILILSVALVAVCWRRLVVASSPDQMSRSAPPVLRMGQMMSAAFAGRSSMQGLRSRPDWLQVRPDLRGCGPGHPVLSLRMALGGAGTPLTFLGWLRQSLGIVLAVVLLAAWLLVLGLRDQDAHVQPDIESVGATVLLGIAAAIGVMQAATSSTYLMARWRLVNAELPLLALLPKLGNHVKRDVLLAALWPAIRVLLAVALVALVVIAKIQQHAIDIVVLLVLVTAVASVVAFNLHVLGGDRRGTRESWTAAILGFALLLTVVAAVLSNDPGNASSLRGLLWLVLLTGWLIDVVMLFLLGRRGWRGLQQRSHPFLMD